MVLQGKNRQVIGKKLPLHGKIMLLQCDIADIRQILQNKNEETNGFQITNHGQKKSCM